MVTNSLSNNQRNLRIFDKLYLKLRDKVANIVAAFAKQVEHFLAGDLGVREGNEVREKMFFRKLGYVLFFQMTVMLFH